MSPKFNSNYFFSFNPVSTTLMKKALKRICTLMGGESFRKLYRVPSVDLVDSIGMAAQGDMRNALINLHFGSLKGKYKVENSFIDNNLLNSSLFNTLVRLKWQGI